MHALRTNHADKLNLIFYACYRLATRGTGRELPSKLAQIEPDQTTVRCPLRISASTSIFLHEDLRSCSQSLQI
jgi:hypothetical protein